MREHEALTTGDALLLEVGGGSADLSFLRKGQPIHSGTYALGSIRMRQNLASWHGTHEQRVRLLRRHIHNVVEDIRREMPLREAKHFVTLGGDVRFAADRIAELTLRGRRATASANGPRALPREAFLAFCDETTAYDVEQVIETFPPAPGRGGDPRPRAARESRAAARDERREIVVPEASLRQGLLLDLARAEEGHGASRPQQAGARQRPGPGREVPLRRRPRQERGPPRPSGSSTSSRRSTASSGRERLLLEVAALLHDIGNYVNLRAHHKHSQYILSVSDIFGLSRDDMEIVANVARYHRRATPQKSHLPYHGPRQRHAASP